MSRSWLDHVGERGEGGGEGVEEGGDHVHTEPVVGCAGEPESNCGEKNPMNTQKRPSFIGDYIPA